MLLPKSKSWGESIVNTTSDIGSAISGSISNTTSKISKAFSDAQGLVISQSNSNEKTLKSLSDFVFGTESSAELFPIGRPCKFNQIVDKDHRFGNYLRTKMNIIDLLPVDYSVDFQQMTDLASGKPSESDNTFKTVYAYGYAEQMKLYKRLCEYHGLDNSYLGIRLYTTDDTTANDTIQVNYKDSTFQGKFDTLSDIGQSYKNFADSILGSTSKQFGSDMVGIGADLGKEIVKDLNGGPALQNLISDLISVSGDMALNGNRMTFPKIWQSSSYNGNMSVNVRLISPYGHPNAVKEFIMKPLSYLILLAAPQTKNGVTYGGNIPLTIKAYGLNHTVLGSIRSITFRRGGSDTSFNLYRQPLSIDLSIEFQTLYDAFAVFDPSEKDLNILKTDRDIFNSQMLTSSSINLYNDNNKNSFMTSLGTILASLRPVQISSIDAKIDPQVYGLFIPPSRDEIPDSPPFSPIAGNLGSSISFATASIEKFSNMITNAPKLIQQGLSNAVYNTAKSTVSSIAGKASGWLNTSFSESSSIVTKINSLF